MAVRVRWVKGSEQEFVSLGKRLQEKLAQRLAAAMMIVIENAVYDAKSLTEDRVDTGAMLAAISGNVEAAGREVVGKFGFTQEKQDYFLYQTVTGFTHWLSGEYIEPTFALLDAYESAKGELRKAVEAAARSL